MGLTVANSGGDYSPPPAGTHLARCFRVIDLGTQKTTWQGVEKAGKKIQIVWELHGEDSNGQPLVTKEGSPLVVSSRYTPSLGNKAALRKLLVSWRGREFTDDELLGFDLKNILGAWCMVTITHNNKGDKTYTNVTSVTGVPAMIKKSGLPEGVSPLVFFDIDSPDMDVFHSFSQYLQDTISSSPEWRMRNGDDEAFETKRQSLDDMAEDDIPFN
jgi:hypothetical protein